MMTSHLEEGIETSDEKIQEAEPILDQMAQKVQNMFKFRKFYDQMGFDPY